MRQGGAHGPGLEGEEGVHGVDDAVAREGVGQADGGLHTPALQAEGAGIRVPHHHHLLPRHGGQGGGAGGDVLRGEGDGEEEQGRGDQGQGGGQEEREAVAAGVQLRQVGLVELEVAEHGVGGEDAGDRVPPPLHGGEGLAAVDLLSDVVGEGAAPGAHHHPQHHQDSRHPAADQLCNDWFWATNFGLHHSSPHAPRAPIYWPQF